MGSSDIWFQLLLTFASVVAGMVVSLWFFRAQQKTDFSRVADTINKIEVQHAQDGGAHHQRFDHLASVLSNIRDTQQIASKDIACIRVATDAALTSEILAQLEHLRGDYHGLNAGVASLSPRIIEDFRKQQEDFMTRIQSEFAKNTQSSKEALKKAIAKELQALLPAAKNLQQVIEKVTEVTGYAVQSMSAYQVQAVKEESGKALKKTDKNLVEAINNLKADVSGIGARLDSLPLMLSSK